MCENKERKDSEETKTPIGDIDDLIFDEFHTKEFSER